jgi:DNA-directed RNA polymerase specialized sigma24 family protein
MSSVPSATIGPDLRTALIAMVRKRVPESEVEDIVQSTLADAIESPHAPTDSESLRRWIFGVAKNKVVDYHRRAGRETFELPEVPGKPAPHAEADLLRWAEKHLPPGDENKTTLDWMLREGEGEKLEWIAEAEKVPAPRVRQRVSRLRRHLKDHWQKEVALLATLGVLITILMVVLKKKEPEPIANEDLPRAAEIRKQAFEKCLAYEWKDCVERLDAAKQLDPAGESRPEVKQARENAKKALTLPPSPVPTSSSTPTPPSDRSAPWVPSSVPTTENTTPPPSPTPMPTFSSSPETKEKFAPRKSIGPKSSFNESPAKSLAKPQAKPTPAPPDDSFGNVAKKAMPAGSLDVLGSPPTKNVQNSSPPPPPPSKGDNASWSNTKK